MSEDQKREGANDADREADDPADRFPRMPAAPNLPEPPRLAPILPPRAGKKPGGVEPGSYSKTALAFTAANSFIMPVIVLAVAGFLLDRKFGDNKGWFTI